MIKRSLLILAGLIVLVGALVMIKLQQFKIMGAPENSMTEAPAAISTVIAQHQTWETLLGAVGSLEAVQGVMVSAEQPGKIVEISFEPGANVEKGDVLIRQDSATEQAQLRAAEATAELARLNRERGKRLLKDKTISQAEFDKADAKYKQAAAECDRIRATIAKKTVRAPFAGRLGVRLVNLGQTIGENDPVVSLQTMDPIFVNFTLPQQQLDRVRRGYEVRVTCDALPGQTTVGQITAINPQVDSATRNVQMQGTLANPDEQLRPGMFVEVAVALPEQREWVVIPATAVLYAPYSDSVFVVESDDKGSSSSLKLRQQFVTAGESRGDFIAIESGLKAGETVVSTGVFRLRNGQSAIVNNEIAPKFELNPTPSNS